MENNKIELLNLILQEFVTKYVIFLSKNKFYLKHLDEEEKDALSLLIKLFFKTLTKTEYLNKYDKISPVKTKKWWIKLYNKLVKPTNSLLNTGLLITSQLISESLGLNGSSPKNRNTQFFEEFAEIDISASENELTLKKNKRHLKELLNKLNTITKKTYFKSSVVLFDKVDEFQDLEQDIHKIAGFTEDILTDTELLLQNDIAIAFSLWSEVKPILSKKVRFDKFKEIDISWKKKDMLPLINKRVLHFSGNRRQFESLFENSTDIEEVISISNNSPRDLISCLSDIYDYQTTNPESNYFESSNVSQGLIKFAKRYDYLSLYPSRTGKNKDVDSTIGKILRLRNTEFSVEDVNNMFNQKTRNSQKWIEQMLRYRLIVIDDRLGAKGEKIYNVTDPKIKHLITRNITSIG